MCDVNWHLVTITDTAKSQEELEQKLMAKVEQWKLENGAPRDMEFLTQPRINILQHAEDVIHGNVQFTPPFS